MDRRRKRYRSCLCSEGHGDSAAHSSETWRYCRRFKRLWSDKSVQSLKGRWGGYSQPKPPFWCISADKRYSAYPYRTEKPSAFLSWRFPSDTQVYPWGQVYGHFLRCADVCSLQCSRYKVFRRCKRRRTQREVPFRLGGLCKQPCYRLSEICRECSEDTRSTPNGDEVCCSRPRSKKDTSAPSVSDTRYRSGQNGFKARKIGLYLAYNRLRQDHDEL